MESRFPVGSSASKILGLLIIALATAALCLSPPEIELGYLFRILSIPNIDINSMKYLSEPSFSSPLIMVGKRMFSSTVSSGSS